MKGPSLTENTHEVTVSVRFKRRVRGIKQLYIKTARKYLPADKPKALPKNSTFGVMFDSAEASSSMRAKTTNSARKSSNVSSAVCDGTEKNNNGKGNSDRHSTVWRKLCYVRSFNTFSTHTHTHPHSPTHITRWLEKLAALDNFYEITDKSPMIEGCFWPHSQKKSKIVIWIASRAQQQCQ